MSLEFESELVAIEEKIKTQRTTATPDVDFEHEIAELESRRDQLARDLYSRLTPWQTVQVARHPNRPLLRDYIEHLCSDFIELHGDRACRDDHGIIGGFATIADTRIMLIGHQKGRTLEDNMKSNFGMANPDGYRKALRLMKLAEKYRVPVVSFIDTPGAYPGLEAEAHGQAEAIARNLAEMSALETPIVVIVTGEGGSGGALGIAVGDVVLMLSNSVYSVISPEGCASILWRDGSKAPEAAEALKLTARSLLELGIIDEIIEEPPGGAHRHYAATMTAVRTAILRHLNRLRKTSTRRLVSHRYDKFARMGRVH